MATSMTAAEAAALLAVNAGARSEKEVAMLLNTDEATARRLVERLRSKGLLEVEERRLLVLRRRRLRLTEKGLEAVPEARRLLAASLAAGPHAPAAPEAQPPSPFQPLTLLLPVLLGVGLAGAALAALGDIMGDEDGDGGAEEKRRLVIDYDPEDWV